MITLDDLKNYHKYNQIFNYFTDSGDNARDLYPKHLKFFLASFDHREVLFLAGNRVGKSVAGAYASTLHLTGDYPDWWVGRRFDKPILCCAAGDTAKTTRDILQHKLLGSPNDIGSGLIPKHKIIKKLSKVGVPDAYEVVYVKHKSGGTSTLFFKSYDQRRQSFQGNEYDLIWLDEEAPLEIYTECLMRTMTTNGLIYTTFTPLQGLSELVLQFCPNGDFTEGEVSNNKNKYLVMCNWDQANHLTTQAKEELWASIPPFQRDARSKGIPTLGAGVIYPFGEDEIIVPDFAIPDYWPKVYGFDVAAAVHKNAAVWLAKNPDTETWYIYSEYGCVAPEPIIHAEAIKARGAWIPGAIDSSSHAANVFDNNTLFDFYKDRGLNIENANKAREAGIVEVYHAFRLGKLKIMKSCVGVLKEIRTYHRDEKGRIVKANDDFMDAMRYGFMSRDRAKTNLPKKPVPFQSYGYDQKNNSWMA